MTGRLDALDDPDYGPREGAVATPGASWPSPPGSGSYSTRATPWPPRSGSWSLKMTWPPSEP